MPRCNNRQLEPLLTGKSKHILPFDRWLTGSAEILLVSGQETACRSVCVCVCVRVQVCVDIYVKNKPIMLTEINRQTQI